MRLALFLLTLTAVGCAPRVPMTLPGTPAASVPGTVPVTGAAVVEAMHARWSGRRPPTLTFVQQTISYRPGGTVDTTTWYEAGTLGRLRIDIEPLETRTAIFYVDGVRTVVRGGEVVNQAPDVNILLLTLMDVFQQPPARTVRMLDSLGVDTRAVRAETWQGRPALVVGAADSSASQLWVDPDRLVAVRVVQRLPDSQMLDAHVGGHREIGGVWHETEIDIHVDGALVVRERYRDVRPGARVEDALFDPRAVPPPRRYWE